MTFQIQLPPLAQQPSVHNWARGVHPDMGAHESVPMTTLFLEAFGRLTGSPIIDTEEEDLWSVFRARGELMGWSTTADDAPLLWSMEEADITAGAGSDRIGFAQVGLEVGPPEELPGPLEPRPARRAGWYGYAPLPFRRKSTDPVVALPALAQCFGDALSRFGDVHLSALQLTISNPDLSQDSRWSYRVSSLNWFNANLTQGADAIVSFDHALLGDHDFSDLLARLTNWRDVPFHFSATRNIPERCGIEQSESTIWLEGTQTSPHGLLATMPEWSPSAIGWVLATVIDLTRDFSQEAKTLAIRITRI